MSSQLTALWIRIQIKTGTFLWKPLWRLAVHLGWVKNLWLQEDCSAAGACRPGVSSSTSEQETSTVPHSSCFNSLKDGTSYTREREKGADWSWTDTSFFFCFLLLASKGIHTSRIIFFFLLGFWILRISATWVQTGEPTRLFDFSCV